MFPFVITAGGETIFRADVAEAPRRESLRVPAESLYLGYPHGPKTAEFVPAGRERETEVFHLTRDVDGVVTASRDSFACNDRTDSVLGSVFGRPVCALDDGVYDRTEDWLLSGPAGRTHVRPLGGGRYRFQIDGPGEIRLRTHYYRDHLSYFLWRPDRPLTEAPVAGWCSWMAHLQDVTEGDVRNAAQFFGENLKDYGYKVIQIDDGYQRVSQFPAGEEGVHEPFSDYWAIPNSKFPSGLAALAGEISSLGLTPGIWVGDYLPLGLRHREGYVEDRDGKPHKGPWVGYAMNGLDVAARDEAYIETIRKLRTDGWRYFKIDTLRHILYDSYRQVPQYWSGRGQSMEEAYRAILDATRRAAGPDSYLLACWGTIPELAGIPDGARIGEDVGPDEASMRRAAKYIAQFQYLNNVVWRNDPDYMCLRVPVPQAETWATLTALAGGHVMVSDPVKDYDAARVDILRRVGPPLFTRPASVVAHGPDPEYLTLAAEKGGASWLVAARFGWTPRPAAAVPLADFGLEPGRTYLAFDFWRERFLGVLRGSAPFDALETGSCQVIGFRPAEDHPQVLGTNRHIGQGAYELEGVRWSGGRLSGTFRRSPGRAWNVYLHCPAGWKFEAAEGGAATADPTGEVVKLTFREGATRVRWTTRWTRRNGP